MLRHDTGHGSTSPGNSYDRKESTFIGSGMTKSVGPFSGSLTLTPSVNAPVAMGYVVRSESEPGTVLFADVRGKRVPVAVSELPFVEANYKRSN